MKTLTDAQQIKQFFPIHSKRMVNNFLLLIICIVQSRTACLYKCRDKIVGTTKKKDKNKPSSNYMRLIRFFKMDCVNEFISGIQMLLMSIVQVESKYLVIDRSNWKIGSKNVNLLTIGGLLSDTFIPLHWLQLDKRGNSNWQERKKVLERLSILFQRVGRSIEGMILLADREFIGDKWLECLRSHNISFVIRLRENIYGELATIAGKKKLHSNPYLSTHPNGEFMLYL